MDLAKVVSCGKAYEWNEGEWKLGEVAGNSRVNSMWQHSISG